MATQTRPVAPPPELPAFKPYVPSAQQPAELTVRALILGAILGIVFAASSVYLALKIGLTVSASIPIAVLAVAFFRTLGNSTILENNIVQTTGSAGESIAAGRRLHAAGDFAHGVRPEREQGGGDRGWSAGCSESS